MNNSHLSMSTAKTRCLHLENNAITGTLPRSMSRLAFLKEFTAHRNKIKGSIPVDIGECRELTLLSLHHNRLTGFLPESITQCVKLKQLFLVKNKLLGRSVPASLYTDTDIQSTPRSGIALNCQVFPSKSPDSDSETEENVVVKEEGGGELVTWTEDYAEGGAEAEGYTEGGGYEPDYGDGGYDNYLGYAGEYVGDGGQMTAYTDGYGAEEDGSTEIIGADGAYYQEEVEDTHGYYDELGNWVEGYYDEEGNWVDTTQAGQEWAGGGEATGYEESYYE